MLACEGRGVTLWACAAGKRVPPAANSARPGGAAAGLPYDASRCARSVSIVISRTFLGEVARCVFLDSDSPEQWIVRSAANAEIVRKVLDKALVASIIRFLKVL